MGCIHHQGTPLFCSHLPRYAIDKIIGIGVMDVFECPVPVRVSVFVRIVPC